jgi:hypothetical protein
MFFLSFDVWTWLIIKTMEQKFCLCLFHVKGNRVPTSSHYYTNNFTRRCPFINGDSHKIQPPRLMPAINGGGRLQTTASKNDLFLEARKSIF